MKQCKIKSCGKVISRIKDTRRAYLAGYCNEHYTEYLLRKNQREEHARQICVNKGCNNTLAGTRNQRYCSDACRREFERRLDVSQLGGIMNWSYMKHTQRMIDRSPLKLGSIICIDDIIVLLRLYVLKSLYQRSYAIDRLASGKYKPKPLLELELCHLYPVGAGGANIPDNIFIAPKFINRKNNSAIPCQDHTFRGVVSHGELIPMGDNLLTGMIDLHGVEAVTEALSGLERPRRFHGSTRRDPGFKGIQHELPLFNLLRNELWRFKQYETASMLFSIERMKEISFHFPIYLELLAILGFCDVLSGERDRLLIRMCRIERAFFGDPANGKLSRRSGGVDDYNAVMYRFIRKYLYRYFGVELERLDSVVAFYNGFFSLPVVGTDWISGKLVCYLYRDGVRHSETTGFFTPDEKTVSLYELTD